MTSAFLMRAMRAATLLAATILALHALVARAAITYQGAGALSDSNINTVAAPYPASVAAGDLLILIIGMKPTGISNGSIATPDSWTLIATAAGGGYGAVPGADTGNTHVFAYYKIADGTETGSREIRLINNNVSWAQMYRLSNATMDWSVAGATGSDNTGGAAVSITMGSDPGVTAGDFILGAMVIPTDVSTPAQFSAQNFTQTGVTFGARTEISEPDSATGSDIGGFVVRAPVTAGTGSAAPVMTATAGGTTTNVRGPGIFIRVRATGAITWQTPGTIAYVVGTTLGTAVICADHPAAVAANDLLVTIIGMKPSVANSGSVATPPGWTAVPGGSLTGAGGYGGTLGADTGNTNVFSFYKVATGNESGEQCFDLTTNSISWAQMYRYSSTTQTWVVDATTGSDATGGAAVSITTSADPGVTVGDHILGAMVIPTDVTTPAQFSAQNFTQTGVTFAAEVEISEPDSANGNDIGGFVVRSTATAGVSSAAPMMTATAGGTTTNVRGPGVFIRIRDEPAFDQAAFRFYEDGSEDGSSATAAQDTNISRDVAPGNSSLQLRVRIQEINTLSGAATDDYQLQYSKNAGAYTNVTGASANVLGFNSASLTDGGATTNRLTAGAGSFVAGVISEDGLADNHQITASNYTEYVYSLTLVSADLANGDTLDFRVLRNGAAIAAYSVTPRITASKVIPGSFNAFETSTPALAITGDILTKIAGSGISVDVVAISGGAQQAGFIGQVKVELLGNVATGVSLDAWNCPTTFSLQQGSNPANPAITGGRATVSFDAVPNVYRDVRVRMQWPASSPTVTWCSADNFAIRPSGFTIAITDTDWQTAGTGRTLNNLATVPGGTTHKAGRPFTITASVSPGTATNYDGNITVASGGLACRNDYGLTGCVPGSLSPGTWSGAGVSRTTSTASYSEAGSFNLTLEDVDFASVDAGETGTSLTVPQTGGAVAAGRFVPNHFSVSANAPAFGAACAAGSFGYVGQSFVYSAAPVLTLTASNFSGGTTSNYKGPLWQVTNATLTGRTYSAASGTLDTSTLPSTGVDPTIDASAANGAGTLTFSAGTPGLKFSRSTPVAPFDADISLAINVIDAEGVVYESPIGTTANPARFGTATAGNGITFSPGGKQMRFGRLRVVGATGSVLLPLTVPIRTEYWNGTAFTLNSADSCTTLDRKNIALVSYAKNLAACETRVLQDPVSFSGGTGTLRMSAPGTSNEGSVTLVPQLGSTITPGYKYCATSPGAEADAEAASKSYLQGAWTGGAYDQNPSARAAFGVFGAQPNNFIFRRETY